MIGAVIDATGTVVNRIVLGAEQVSEMRAALGMEVLDAAPYALMIGDRREGTSWTRNVDGEMVTLTPLAQEEIDRVAAFSAELEADEAEVDAALDALEEAIGV